MWHIRKEALDAVQKLCENPKIEPGDHGPLVEALRKVREIFIIEMIVYMLLTGNVFYSAFIECPLGFLYNA